MQTNQIKDFIKSLFVAGTLAVIIYLTMVAFMSL